MVTAHRHESTAGGSGSISTSAAREMPVPGLEGTLIGLEETRETDEFRISPGEDETLGIEALSITTTPCFSTRTSTTSEDIVVVKRQRDKVHDDTLLSTPPYTLHEQETNTYFIPSSIAELRATLQSLGLSAYGHKTTLKTRLRKHFKALRAQNISQEQSKILFEQKKQQMMDELMIKDSEELQNQRIQRQLQRQSLPRKGNQPYKYYLVFDVEATCNEESTWNWQYPNEIIEFPVVVVCGSTWETIDTFHSYVKPELNPVLDPFCVQLTGITQQTVDSAPTFLEVLKQFHHFLLQFDQPPWDNILFVTDGPWDLRDFLMKQCHHLSIPFPHYTNKFCDVRLLFSTYHNIPRRGINAMLNYYGMEFEGREHSGIDDAMNVKRVMVNLMARGVVIVENSVIHPASGKLKTIRFHETKFYQEKRNPNGGRR